MDLKPLGCTLSGGLIWFSPLINRILRLTIPFLVAGALIGVIFWLYDDTTALQLGGLLLLYFVPPAGKESIIPAGIALGFPFQVMCLSIVMVDIACCLFMIWNFELICNVPYLGNIIRYLIKKGELYLAQHRWLEQLYFIGLTLFVFFPLQGTGSVSGSIIGKMLGLKSIEIFAAITIGSLLSSFLIGYSVYALQEYFDMNVWYVLAGVICIIIVLPLLSYGIYKTRTGHRILRSISDSIHRLSDSKKRE
ncbi:MAG TPA: small multi-drug export protein [Methanospirillum sp.]|uniref:small multi-drug export protein n=1 Tax=Methanospirillum sp. TaxID=45200 RepID=UPI002CF85B9B|nr:small multi-drug export protein [Methanospirillum sp.]HOJ96474.1 small multi-drug export protein [Methanospirillum sp.]HPP77275.1 small multi-drug export protein [Methanospirillum sp.]